MAALPGHLAAHPDAEPVMGTLFRVPCPTCGDVELTPPDVELYICFDTKLSRYTFMCPVCYVTVTRQAPPSIVAILCASPGPVRIHRIAKPAELDEKHTGPPICLDDVIAFHFEIAALSPGGTDSDQCPSVPPATNFTAGNDQGEGEAPPAVDKP